MIYLASPAYGGLSIGTHASIRMMDTNRNYDVFEKNQDFSALCFNFNTMWCDMLNRRKEAEIDYWVMIHSDIEVIEVDWLEKLIGLLQYTCCDVLSVVSPIKDERGLTSTGIYDLEDGRVFERLTMTELDKLPKTFNYLDVVETIKPNLVKGHRNCLVVNTGLMIVRVDDWCEKIYFRTKDWIVKDTNGKFRAEFKSEDWLFSLDAFLLNKQVVATRDIKLNHIGINKYPNYGIWGTLLEDNLS